MPLKRSVERNALESACATSGQLGGVLIDGAKPIDAMRTEDTATTDIVDWQRRDFGCPPLITSHINRPACKCFA